MQGFTIFFSYQNRGASIVSSNISDCNVSFPDGEGDEAEWVRLQRSWVWGCGGVVSRPFASRLYLPAAATAGAAHSRAVRHQDQQRQHN